MKREKKMRHQTKRMRRRQTDSVETPSPPKERIERKGGREREEEEW